MTDRVIDPAAQARKTLRDTRGSQAVYDFAAIQGSGYLDYYGSLAVLCSTPRVLKVVLRRFSEAWNVLRGEIDFHHLLAACVIRETRPDVFGLIDGAIGAFRAGLPERDIAREKQVNPSRERLARLIDSETTPMARMAVESIVQFMFPRVHLRHVNAADGPWPQSFASGLGTDHWERFKTLVPGPPELSDQRILRALRDWNESGSGDLPTLLLEPAIAELARRFEDILDERSILRLFLAVARKQALTQVDNGIGAPNVGVRGALVMMSDRDLRGRQVLRTTARVMYVLVRTNLALAEEVDRFVLMPGQRERFFDESMMKDVERVRSWTRRVWAKTMALVTDTQIAEVLWRGSPYALMQFAWGIERIRDGSDKGVPFEEWGVVSEVLLRAGKTQPDAVLPVIVPLIVSKFDPHSYARREDAPPPEVRKDQAEQLFGIDDVLRLFVGREPPRELDENLTVRFNAIVRRAADRFAR